MAVPYIFQNISGGQSIPLSHLDDNFAAVTNASSIDSGTLSVLYGGTGANSFTAHGILLGNGTSGFQATAVGLAGQILQGGGASSDPAWSFTPVLGANGSAAGTLGLRGSTSGTVTVRTAASAGTWSLTLPTTAGTSGYFLSTDGSGNTSWAYNGITINTTPISGGSNTRILYDNNGSVGIASEIKVSGSSTLILGSQGTTLGLLTLSNQSGDPYPVSIQSSTSPTAAWVFVLPPNPGTNNYFLKTDGLGTTSWAQPAANQVTNTPAGNIAATNVQTAINELDTEKSGKYTSNIMFSGTYSAPGSAGSFTFANNVNTLLQYDQYGTTHNIIYMDSDNGFSCGDSDVKLTWLWAQPLNLYRNHQQIRFAQIAGSTLDLRLSKTVIGAGTGDYGTNNRYTISTGTGSAGDGVELRATNIPVEMVAGQRLYFFFDIPTATNLICEFGANNASGGNSYMRFKRTDAGTEGSWYTEISNAGTSDSYGTGVTTGVNRQTFIIETYTSGAGIGIKFYISTAGNVPTLVATFGPAAATPSVNLFPYFKFISNGSAVNRTAVLSQFYWILVE